MYISARHSAHGRLLSRSDHLQLFYYSVRRFFRRYSVRKRRFPSFIRLEHYIIAYAHPADKPHAQSVLGDKSELDPESSYLRRSLTQQLFFLPALWVDVHYAAALLSGEKPRDTFQQLFLTAAGDSRDAEYLSAVSRKAYIGKDAQAILTLAVQVADKQSLFYIDRLVSLYIQSGRSAYHHVRQRLGRRLARVYRTYVFTLSQYGYPVRQLHYLVQLVRDYYYRLAVVPHIPQYGEKPLGLLRSQNRRRLVEYQYIRAAVKHFHYLYRLLLRYGQLVYMLGRIDVKAILAAYISYLFLARFRVQSALFLQAEQRIFRDRQHIYELEMLMYHSYP